MIEDIYRIGLTLKETKTPNAIDEDITPNTSVKIDQIVVISLGSDGSYQGLRLLEYGSENALEILLKKKSPNGPNYAPSAQITEIKKTLNGKIIGWFKWAKDKGREFGLDTDEIEFINKAMDTLRENEAGILGKYRDFELPKKGSYALVVAVDGKFPINIPAIFKIYTGSLREKRKSTSTGKCCLCNRSNIGIIPKSSVFKFFSDDKPGNISGGFNKSKVWRNYPVCADCETILGKAKEYIWNNLDFYFVDMRYYIIPSTILLEPTLEVLKEILEELRIKKFSFKEEAQKSQKKTEKQIWEIITQEADINSFRLLFIETQMSGNVERIVLELKDVYPSRIKRLYNAKKVVDECFEGQSEGFNFKFIRNFLSKSDKKTRENDLDNLFLDITRKLFLEEKIEQKVLLPHFMRRICLAFFAGENLEQFSNVVLEAWISIAYLIEAGCIKSERSICMNTKFDELFKKYGAGLDSEVKCALFLTGALIRKVMDIQYVNIKSSPFRERLMGLKMKQADVLRVINEAEQKMHEYDCRSNESRQVIECIMQLILKSPSKWPLTVDEINFYISAGMSLYKEIYLAAGEN